MKNKKTLKHIITLMIFMLLLATVSACGGGGGGGGGGSVITPDPEPVIYTAPSAVTNLSIEYGNKFGEMILSWTGPQNAGSSALKSYNVRYSNDNNSFYSINFSPVTPIPAGRTESITLNALTTGNVINFDNSAIKPGCNLHWSVISSNSNPNNFDSPTSNTASKKLPWRTKIKVLYTKDGNTYFYETYFGIQGNAVDNVYDSKSGFDSPLPAMASLQNIYAYFEEKGELLTSSIHSSATAKNWRLVVAGTALAAGNKIKIEFPDYNTSGPFLDQFFLDEVTPGSLGTNTHRELPDDAATPDYVIGNNGQAIFNIYGQ